MQKNRFFLYFLAKKAIKPTKNLKQLKKSTNKFTAKKNPCDTISNVIATNLSRRCPVLIAFSSIKFAVESECHWFFFFSFFW